MEYELGDVIRDHYKKLKLTPQQSKVLYKLRNCRTAFLGKHEHKCNNPNCNHVETSFNSCRDRHCPKCSGSKQIKWVNERNKELLPVQYSHAVFRVPSYLYLLFLFYPKDCYDTLFKSVKKTIEIIFSKNKDIKIGYIALLHTWTQQLFHHPHLHCLIPEGKFNSKTGRWIDSNNSELKKDIMNITFKKILTMNIIKLIEKKKINLLGISKEFLLEKSLKPKKWVYIRPSLLNITNVISYLGRFSTKIAISNKRITSYDGVKVEISYVDRADGNKIKYTKINAVDFLKRFTLHILPNGYTKIRYYGFLSGNCKNKYLSACKEFLKSKGNKLQVLDSEQIKTMSKLTESITKLKRCPVCNKGLMVLNKGRYGPEKTKTA